MKNVLGSRTLKYSRPGEFNDPYELRPTVTHSDPARYAEAFRELARMNPGKSLINFPPPTVAEKQEWLDYLVTHEILILCLSANWDIIRMWSHYADEHRGFAVGFVYEENLFPGLDAVAYGERPVFDGPIADLHDAVYTKDESWADEQEWRSLRAVGNNPPRREPPQLDKPGVYLLDIPANAVTEVVMGMRMAPEARLELLSLLSAPEFRHVSLWQAEETKGHYGIARTTVQFWNR